MERPKRLALGLFVILSLFVLVHGTSSKLPTYECTMNTEMFCALNNIQLSKESSDFQPVAKDPLAVKEVLLNRTTLPVLTNTICKTFPNLEAIWAINNGIEELSDDAFVHCPKLQVLSLHGNHLTSLHADTFKNNHNLEHLYISKNHLTVLPDNLFANLTKLTQLDMDHNHLTEFDAGRLLRNMGNLQYFEIFSNHLLDLNVTTIIQLSPRLKEIWIGDNDFQCDRLEEMLRVLTAAGIRASTFVMTIEKRKRTYKPDLFNGTECLNAEQWLESAKRAVEIRNKINRLAAEQVVQDVDQDDVEAADDTDDDEVEDEGVESPLITFEFSQGDGCDQLQVPKQFLLVVFVTFVTSIGYLTIR